MKILSIIIPVYNVEKYLKQCVDSVISNKFDNIEIILVNDGSTDNSGVICEEYAKRDNRILAFNKKNGGLSDARNYGINEATGKYLMFLDSDDFIESNKLKGIIEILNRINVDVLMSPYNEIVDDEVVGVEAVNELLGNDFKVNNKELLECLFNNTKGLWTAWKYIVRKEFLRESGIEFKKGFLHEDVDYTTRILLKMNTFQYYNVPWYCYRTERVGSIMNKKGFKSLQDTTQIILDLNTYMINEKINKDVMNCVLEKLSSTLYTLLNLYKYGSDEERWNIISTFERNKYLLSYSKNNKHKLFNFMAKFIGIEKMLKFYSSVL